MTRTAKTVLAKLTATFGASEFVVNYSLGVAYSDTGDVYVSGKVFSALVAAGAVRVRDGFFYSVVGA